MVSKLGWRGERKPSLVLRRIKASTFWRSLTPVEPHHAGEAYVSVATSKHDSAVGCLQSIFTIPRARRTQKSAVFAHMTLWYRTVLDMLRHWYTTNYWTPRISIALRPTCTFMSWQLYRNFQFMLPSFSSTFHKYYFLSFVEIESEVISVGVYAKMITATLPTV